MRPAGEPPPVTSLFQRAVGDAWSDLHPALRDRYGLTADDGRVAVGRGEMARITTGGLVRPVLWLAARRDFLFPSGGADVPFAIGAHAAVDRRGNEAITFRRRFETDPPRAFVDTMRWNPERGCLTSFFGRGGRVASDLHPTVVEGGLEFQIGAQWLRVGGGYRRVPDALAARGTVRDWYDEAADRYRVGAAITAPVVGHVFGYLGSFDNEWLEGDERGADEAMLAVPLPGADD